MPDITTTEKPKGMGIGDIAKGAIGPVIGAGLGLLLEGHNNRQQIKQQQKLTDIQSQANRDQAAYSSNLQFDMWNKTNYEAQVKHMNQAGLNPALLYGQGGGGGTTTGSANAAGVNGASAQQNTGQIQQGMGLGMQTAAQIALLQAQTENIKADTAEKLSKTPVNNATVPNIQADTKGKEADARSKVKDAEFKEWITDYKTGPGKDAPTLRQNEALMNNQTQYAHLNEINATINELNKSAANKEKSSEILEQQYQKLKQMNPMEIERYAKELEVWKRDPANSEGAQWANMLTKILGNFFGIKVIGH